MTVRTGEKTRTACKLRCSVCRTCFQVEKSKLVTECRKCGSGIFDIITGELELPGAGPKKEK